MSHFTQTALILTLFNGSCVSSARASATFNEVRDTLLSLESADALPEEREERKAYESGGLPHYTVTVSSFFKHGLNVLAQAAQRTINDRVDYYPRLKKLLHPNGVCLTGTWEITRVSPQNTGYFTAYPDGKAKKALFIGRASVALSDTEKGKARGFGFAGKIFPTENANESVETANFFTVDVLAGTRADHYTDVALTNSPETGFNWSAVGVGLWIASSLKKGDQNPGFRPLYPISELGVKAGQPAKNPTWMRLHATSGTAKISEADFRDELDIRKYYPSGLQFDIDVSNTTRDRNSKTGWEKIGQIKLTESITSYGCDRQLHFAHPILRNTPIRP